MRGIYRENGKGYGCGRIGLHEESGEKEGDHEDNSEGLPAQRGVCLQDRPGEKEEGGDRGGRQETGKSSDCIGWH
jgi:hypothetical protein